MTPAICADSRSTGGSSTNWAALTSLTRVFSSSFLRDRKKIQVHFSGDWVHFLVFSDEEFDMQGVNIQ